MSFGAEVRRLRDAAGLTQAQLAQRVGISQPYLARIENEKHQAVAIDVAFRFADALGVDVNTFRPFFTPTPPAAASPPPLAAAVASKRK